MDSLIQSKTIKNIIKVAISNIITMLAGVLVGFILPKIIGVQDYGYYKTFTLYASYVGLIHIGITDGIYLKYGGKDYEELEIIKEKFRLFNTIVFLLDFFFSLSLCITAIFIPDSNIKFIFIALAVFLIASNMVGHFQIISQITNRFNELTIKNILQSSLTILSIIALWLLNKYLNYSINYKIYLFIYLSIVFVSATFYTIRYRKIVFGKKESISNSKKEIGYLIRIGIPLLIANLCTSLILTIDRQIVNIFWPVSTSNEYPIYAFAYNLLSLVTVAISAISTVIYPTLKKTNEETLKNSYPNLLTLILSFCFFCLILYYPLRAFITWFLPKYVNSIPIFRVIFPGIVLSSTISIVFHNYFKVAGKSSLFFLYSLIVLGLCLVSDIVVYFIFHSTLAISIASVFCIAIWYILSDLYFIRKYNVSYFKNYLLIAFLTTSFYMITLIDNIIVGFLAHLFVTLLAIYFFNFERINTFIKKIFLRNTNKPKDD